MLQSNRLSKSPKAYTPTAPFDLAKESDEALAKLALQTENEWFSLQSLMMSSQTPKG